MAPKAFQLCLCISLFCSIIVLLPLPSRAKEDGDEKPSSPFDFIKHLQGCHRGEKVKGLHQLKKYLENFGYLNYHHHGHHHSRNHRAHSGDNYEDDDFDELLESAIKTYQLNYHLKPTGTLDSQTVARMTMPRCGVPDIVNGTNSMTRSAGKKRNHPKTLHTVSHYTFFQGNPKWPASQTHLTYGFPRGTDPRAMTAVARAFDKWASSTHFTFSRAQEFNNADLKVSFHRRNHGDGFPFDGPGGALAHAWSPTDGRFHYDADERWSVGAVAGAHDLETVALHEIGHLLGLGHSAVEDAIMYSTIASGVTKGLHGDDIQGIKALYNIA